MLHWCVCVCVCFPQLMDLKLTVSGLEKERDFYFSKLRDIELVCQEHESDTNPVLGKVLEVLYATEVTCIETQALLMQCIVVS